MNELTDRQKLILALVVRDYIETARPVSSGRLVRHYGLDMSSATVRNELAALTEAGYLRQPHTSAGRVPTEEGYRYFVGQLMGRPGLPPQTRRTIAHQFYQARPDVEEWVQLAASVLAQHAHAASLVTTPHPEQVRLKHLELIATRSRQVLMVLVLSGGEVRQQILTLTEPVPQERLSRTAAEITAIGRNLEAEDLAKAATQLGPLGRDVVKLVCDEMVRAGQVLGNVYRDGLTQVLTEPEFAESETARRALRVFEERALLEDLISRTMMTTDVGGVQVLIGGEGQWEELRDCSMVLARYGAPGRLTGTMGVLGPIRMAYGRTISTVRFVAGLLSDLVVEMLVE